MALTRLIAEKLLVGPDMLSGRLGRRAAMAKLFDPAAATLGAIPAVGAMLGEALRGLGIYPADPTDPQDADFAPVAADRVDRLADVAELRGLRMVLGNLDELDEQVGTDKQDWTKFAEHVRLLANDLEARCEARYGVSGPSVGFASFDLGFGQPWPGGCP